MDRLPPGVRFNPTRYTVPDDQPLPPGHVLCCICGAITDDWVHAQCRPCSDLPGAVLLTELRNAHSWAETRLNSAIEVEEALTGALSEARDARTHLENLVDLSEANYVQMTELVKNIRGAGLAEPVCECGHSSGKHISKGKRCLEMKCDCQAFKAQPALSFISMRKS